MQRVYSPAVFSGGGGGVRASVRTSNRMGPRGMVSNTSMMRRSAVSGS
jgi:hypothetical protein